MEKLTRGERNNNPGNIERTGITWQGMSDDQSGDSRFIVFDSPEYGIRALAKLISNYVQQGNNTIRRIINRYAPSSENNTSAYINSVSSSTGINPDSTLNFNDNPRALESITKAIIQHENGRVAYDDSTIKRGIQMVT